MARRIPENRFDELVRAATEVFISKGYRQTQMSDVAEAVEVAKGTLYGYVESKDALLSVCLVWGDEPGPISLPETLPIPTLPPGQLSQRVKEALGEQTRQPILAGALTQAKPADAIAELHAVIGEFFDLMHRNRHRIKLLDRCVDHPELSGLWQTEGREQPRLMLARYLEGRMEEGHFRPMPNARLAARIVIETVATWAVHIHWDRAPEAIDFDEARELSIDFLVRAFVA